MKRTFRPHKRSPETRKWAERQREKAVESELSEKRLMALIAKADAAGLHRRCMMRLSEMPCVIINGSNAVFLDAGEVKDYDTGDNITLAAAERLLGLEGIVIDGKHRVSGKEVP